MDGNKKIYSIQINGIDQSIKQVDALSDALQNLDKKIKDLESRSVNITSSNSGGSSRNADLQTEDKLLKQIQSTEQQIRDARREDYQSLLAQKDILKDIVDETKQRAAQERLSSGNYGNTMKGLKEELSDIKKVMQTTDLGSEKFNDLTKRAGELTNKLKDLEQAYGQFGRNVGNYKSAFDDVKKVTVQVGNTAREFNSVRDASRQLTQELKAMSIAGKEDTEEYKELADALHNFEMATKKAESAVNDLKASSKGMDDILDTFESLGYLASTTQGLSALFGFDNSSIERSIQKLVALQNVLQGIEKLRLKIKAGDAGIIGDLFKGGNQAVDSFVAKLTGAQMGINGLTKGSRAATLAVRGLSLALKGLGIGLVIGALTTLISILEKYTSETSKADIASENLSMTLNTLNKEYERKRDLLSSSYMKQEISDAKYLADMFKLQADNIRETTSALQEMSKMMNSASWTDYLSPSYYLNLQGTGYTGSRLSGTSNKTASDPLNSIGNYDYSKMFKDIEAAEKEFEKLQDAVKKGNDYLDQYGKGLTDWIGSLVITVGDTKDIMVGVGNAIASDMNARLIEAMANLKQAMSDNANGVAGAEERVRKYKDEVRSLYKEMNSSAAYQSFLANMDKYIPDESVREKLQNILSSFQDFYNSMDENSEKWIHYWNQVRIDGMKDGNAKINAQIEENRRHEIAEYGDTQEHVNAINAKYNRQRLDQQEKYNEQAKNKAKQHAREMEAAEKELQTLRIQNMAEGLNKQLAQLEEERRERIAKAKENGIKVGEITLEINKLYDKKVLDAKKEWAYKIEQVYTNMWSKIYQINHQNAQMDFENQLRDMDTNYQKLKDAAARNAGTSTQGYSNKGVAVSKTPKSKSKAGSTDSSDYNYKVIVEKDIDYTKRLEEEFRTRTEARKKYYAEVEKLTIEEENKRYQIETKNATESLNNELRTLHNSYSAQDHEMEEHYKKGEITRSQYNEAVNRLNEERAEQEAQIQIKYNTESEQRERQHYQNIANAENESNTAILTNYQEMMEKLNGINSSEVVRNGIGFLNITATRRRNKELIAAYQDLSNKIGAETKRLGEKLKSNDITAEQKKQIEQLIEMYKQLLAQIGVTLTTIQNNTKSATEQFISECNQYVQEVGQSLNSILGSLSEISDNHYQAEIEKQQKYIDKYEELLNEQKEITQEHASEVNSIEDELSTARGDRRQHLIDQLNAEMAAQRASLAQEKKIEAQKKKEEQKLKKLEHDQAVAKKKMQLAQAAINMAMAISMAAVNSWPVPAIPMMALAAAAGAAQIAAIQSQNIPSYGSGGVIQGKSHREGGVKVLGGQAEVEGGEYITNKVTTAKNVDLLEYINTKRRKINLEDLIDFYGGNSQVKKSISTVRTKFADGGMIPTLRNDINLSDRMLTAFEDYSNRPVQVAVVDIIDRTQQVNDVKVMAGLDV